ncbi:MAG TPA: GlsB/YeaQ/YmgE family stress response membrane protein [Acidimicrobiales bacterium]|nr:GlsB/YeaQ/YmgE family stress response membrane protein [Acidimicrobiales bacterium]
MTTLLALTPAGESLVWFLIVLFLIGLIVGAIARLIVPGPHPIGILGTAAAGVAGAILGTIVGRLLFGPAYQAGWIMSILGAAVVVWAVSRRRSSYYY